MHGLVINDILRPIIMCVPPKERKKKKIQVPGMYLEFFIHSSELLIADI